MAVVVFAPTPLHAGGGQGKPVKEVKSYPYFMGPKSDSLFQMITESDAVVRGKVVGRATHVRDVRRGSTEPPIKGAKVMTTFRVKVLETLHTAGDHVVDVSKPLPILRSGGDRDRGEYVERHGDDGFPLFQYGREYLLFLRWSAPNNAWMVAYGPDGVLDITTGVVESPGTAAVTKGHKETPAADVLKHLRRYGQK
jgi:hypothetical protein